MKKNRLVNRTAFANALRNDLHEALNQLAKDTHIPKSILLDKAVELLLIEYGRLDKE